MHETVGKKAAKQLHGPLWANVNAFRKILRPLGNAWITSQDEECLQLGNTIDILQDEFPQIVRDRLVTHADPYQGLPLGNPSQSRCQLQRKTIATPEEPQRQRGHVVPWARVDLPGGNTHRYLLAWPLVHPSA